MNSTALAQRLRSDRTIEGFLGTPLAPELGWREELERRTYLYHELENDEEAQVIMRSLCASNFFVWTDNFAWTHDPRKQPSLRPFIMWPFQRRACEMFLGLVDEAWHGDESPPDVHQNSVEHPLKPVVREKPRDMGATWCDCACVLWGWQFHGHCYGVLSQRTDEVDDFTEGSLFGKIRFMLYRQPRWLRPTQFRSGYRRARTTQSDVSMRMRRRTDQFIRGSGGRNPHRARRYRRILVDEAAHVSNLEGVLAAIEYATPSPWLSSSVNGRNAFWRRARGDLSRGWALMDWNWRMHPEHDKAWYERQRERSSEETFAQEVECDYERSVRGRIYREWSSTVHVLSDERAALIETDLANMELMEAWDFATGATSWTCVVWAYYAHHTDELYVWDYLMDREKPFEWYAEQVGLKGYRTVCRNAARVRFSDNRTGRLPDVRLGDPAGRQRESDQRSWFNNLDDYCGIVLHSAATSIPARVGAVRLQLRRRKLLFHPRLKRLHRAMAEYRWDLPESFDPERDPDPRTVKPRKDENSHPADCVQYLCHERWGHVAAGYMRA